MCHLKKFLSVIMVIMLMTAALSGCSSPQDKPAEVETQAATEAETEAAAAETPESSEADTLKVLNYNLGADPKTLDPGLNSAIDGSHILNNTFEALTREIGGEIKPAMAARYEVSEDGLVYTFHLRDAKWSDGQPVTAQDFEFAWQRAIKVETAAPYASHFFYIKNAQDFYEGNGSLEDVGIKAVDEKTFQVTLEAPTPYFLSLITRPAFMPVRKEIIESGDESWFFKKETAISNGPFVLESYATGDKIVLKKNPNYWNADSVQIDQINCLMIVESSTSLTAFQAGNLDIINNIPTQEITRLLSEDDSFYILPKMGTYYLQFNMNVDALKDVRVRKALSLALDRKSITENVMKGGEIPATGFNPVGLKDSQGNDFNTTAGDYYINVDGGNVEEAQKLLAEAGYPNGEGFPQLTALYNTSESHKAVFEVIQEAWKQNLGINIELANQEWAVFQSNRVAHNFEIARGGYIGDYPDPVGLLELLAEDSSNNHPDWHNQEFNELINKSRFASGSERDAYIYRAEEILMEDAPIAPIFYYTDPLMVNERVSGWEKNSMSYWYFGNVDIM